LKIFGGKYWKMGPLFTFGTEFLGFFELSFANKLSFVGAEFFLKRTKKSLHIRT